MTIKESTEQQLKSIPDMTYLETEDIANATLYVLGTPKNVQVGLKYTFYSFQWTKSYFLKTIILINWNWFLYPFLGMWIDNQICWRNYVLILEYKQQYCWIGIKYKKP